MQSISFTRLYFFKYMDKPKTIAGITGTNGKTTTSHIIKNILDSFEIEELVLVGHSFGGRVIIKLTGKYLPDDNKNEVSLNSPIGKALYRSKIGTTISYEVNSKKIKVYIIRKVMQDA